MQRYTISMKLEEKDYLEDKHDDFACGECGKTFQKPILATNSSSGLVQKYYACPRCLTQIHVESRRQEDEEKETSVLMKSARKTAAKLEDAVGCKHFLGYLKKRPKDMAIPDECLTCASMVECLAR
jgi:DNA-directed RNA polymerase subunit RPC12/RpoP